MKNPCLALVALFLSILGVAKAQTSTPKALLTESDPLGIGKTITIASQFRDLPLVEPHIAAHSTDNDHLLVAAMVVTDITAPYESCRLSSFVSKDGGITWHETVHDYWGYDPWTAILPNGQTVMSWIGTSGRFKGRYPIQLFSSEDGGTTWSDQVQTLPGGHDGTKLAALNNVFYFTTVHFRHDMGADVMLYRKEGSSDFVEVAKIDGDGKRLNFCEPAVLSDGTVVVPGSHFLKEAWIHRYKHPIKEWSEKYPVTSNPGGGRGYMRMVADTSSTSGFQDRLYFARALGEDHGVLLNYSSDGGKTWSTDARIDLFESPLSSKAMVVSIAVNKDGVLGVSWVDAQSDANQQRYDVYFTISKDGGIHFQRPVRVTQTSTDPKTAANGDVANKFPGGGHYLGLAARPDGSFQLVWSDSRSGIFELQTCNINLQ